jgi:nucleotide-binding universal stress UspA family protein
MAALAEGAGKKMPGIVVSVDGSADSQRALTWAATYAGREHSALTVLAVHRVAASSWTGKPIIYPEDQVAAAQVLKAAEETVSKTIGELGDDQPSSVTVVISIGQVGDALIDASHDADMVVVGTHRSSFPRNMLSSVRSQVVSHAACPVVVVSDRQS